MPTQSQSPSLSPKIYRIGLYGRPSAGKTCLLAALALGTQRKPHPQGYGCVLADVEMTDEETPTSGGPETSPDAAQFPFGHEEIVPVKEALAQGVPPPRTEMGKFRRFQFEFFGDAQIFLVELLDYSGELISPKHQHNPEGHAGQLLSHMARMDALFVLAEVPRVGNEDDVLPQELDLLAQTFTTLQKRLKQGDAHMRGAILGLLVNKWDRLGSVESAKQQFERERLDQMLNGVVSTDLGKVSLASHQNLANLLKNSVAEGSFERFPLSAFGDSKITEECHTDANGKSVMVKVEGPKQSPIGSFGLEDPFLWAVRRRDTLDADEFVAEVAALPQWWQPCVPFGRHPLHRKGRVLLGRLLPDRPEYQQVQQSLTALRSRQWTRSLTTLAGAMFLLLSLEAIWDGWHYGRVTATLENQSSSNDQVIACEDWLRGYAHSGLFQHRFHKLKISQNLARQKLDNFQKAREAEAWRPVEQEPELVAKAILTRYENGPHAGAARTIVSQSELAQQRRENESWLSGLDQKLTPTNDEVGLQRLIETIDKDCPHSKVIDDHFAAKRADLSTRAAKKLADEIYNKAWTQFVTQFRAAWEANRVVDAGNLLMQREPKDDNWRKLVGEFQDKIAERFTAQVNGIARDKRWAETDNAFRNFRGAHARWPKEMQLTTLKWVDSLESQKRIEEDQALYEAVRSNESLESCENYLKEVTGGSMHKVVSEFKRYLEGRDQPADFVLKLDSIEWGKTAINDDDNEVTVSLEDPGSVVVIKTKKNIVSKPETTVRSLGQATIRGKKMSDSINVSLNIIEYNRIFANSPHGSGKSTVTIHEALKKGIPIRLNFDGGSHEAKLTLQGGPKKPELPAWRPR